MCIYLLDDGTLYSESTADFLLFKCNVGVQHFKNRKVYMYMYIHTDMYWNEESENKLLFTNNNPFPVTLKHPALSVIHICVSDSFSIWTELWKRRYCVNNALLTTGIYIDITWGLVLTNRIKEKTDNANNVCSSNTRIIRQCLMAVSDVTLTFYGNIHVC